MMWLNGKLVEAGKIEASGAGLNSGWGVFTTLGVRSGKPRFLARHFARLGRDARAADVPLEWDFAAISQGLEETLALSDVKNGLARLTLSRRGDGRWNTRSGADLSILALETPPATAPLRVQLSPFRVENRRPLCGVKTTSYLPYLWAWREARARGFDEAILRDGHDFLSEAARSTLFWIDKNRLFTPSLQTGALAGIGRELALEWAQNCGLEAQEGEFAAREIESASEIWLVSAASGPKIVASWHDEDGIARLVFPTKGAVCGEFASWFEAQNE